MSARPGLRGGHRATGVPTGSPVIGHASAVVNSRRKSYATNDRILVLAAPSGKSMADTILNRYEIKDVLGRTGISVIYRAFDCHSSHDVAIETVWSRHDQVVSNFRNEWQTLKRLHHHNVIDVYDFGEFKKGGDSFSFIARPLLHGRPLDQKIGNAGNLLDSTVVVDVISQVCQALQYVHQQGIVHRNIQPSNIFITTEKVVKLLGFQLARDLNNKNQESPTPGEIVGTIHYMAPEQFLGLAATVASDIFGLGAVCYEALSGRRPFDGLNSTATILAITREDPIPLMSIRPDLDSELSQAVQKALAKRVEERYSSAEEFAKAMRRTIVTTNS